MQTKALLPRFCSKRYKKKNRRDFSWRFLLEKTANG